MTQFFAQPYSIEATGFYFETAEEFHNRAASCTDHIGRRVEEFEIQFIDGEELDAELCKALQISQGNLEAVIDLIDTLDTDEKLRVAIACNECGYVVDPSSASTDDLDIDLYFVATLSELAEQFIDDGLFGRIPEGLACYIDLDAIARDLGMDYSETTIAGQMLIYRCG